MVNPLQADIYIYIHTIYIICIPHEHIQKLELEMH